MGVSTGGLEGRDVKHNSEISASNIAKREDLVSRDGAGIEREAG